MANEKLYQIFSEMNIDEDREILDISDHMMLNVTIKIKDNKKEVTPMENDYYMSLNERKMEAFIRDFETELQNTTDITLEKYDELIIKISDKILKTKVIKSRKGEKGKVEPIWMNKEIKNEIKERKKYNKLKRYCLNNQESDHYEKKYIEHKTKVQSLIKEEITKYEKRITEEIKADKSKKMWENINYLRGKNKTNKKVNTENCIYDENGDKIYNANTEIKNFWSKIYLKHENNTKNNWSQNKEAYKESILDENLEINGTKLHYSLREHFDMCYNIDDTTRFIKPMKTPNITEKELIQQVKKMKNKKTPGPDNIKTEIYKKLIENKNCCSKLLTSLNDTIQNNTIPNNWRYSTTKLIEKKKTMYRQQNNSRNERKLKSS